MENTKPDSSGVTPSTESTSEFITLKAFLSRYDISYSTFRNMEKNGLAPVVQRLTSRTLRISLKDLEQWEMQKRNQQKHPQAGLNS